MPGDLRHKEADRSLATQLTQAEFDKITAHHLESQATGDIIYAASATQLAGLAVGTLGHVLTMGVSLPAWAAATSPAHAASHEDAGGDEVSVTGLSGLLADDQHVLDAEVVTAAKTVKLDDFATPDDNTDLDASGAKHGLMPKADASKLGGIAAGADVTGSNAPQVHAASHQSAGGDSIKLDDFATPDDNTDLDFGTARHGLVPKGLNAGDFLKDDGTWAATGVSDPHGAAQHTDVTRELWLPSTAAHMQSGLNTTLGRFGTIRGGANANEPYIFFAMKVPDDFVSFTKVEAVWASAAAAGDMYWQLQADYGASGEAYNIHSENPGIGVTATGGANIVNAQEPAAPLTLSSLASGDYIGIQFSRNGASGSDTIDAFAHILGLRFTYTAHQ